MRTHGSRRCKRIFCCLVNERRIGRRERRKRKEEEEKGAEKEDRWKKDRWREEGSCAVSREVERGDEGGWVLKAKRVRAWGLVLGGLN